MSDPVRILVVDDSDIFAEMMRRAIEADERATLVGVAKDGSQGVDAARRLKPDVISMDVYMPGMDGIDAVLHIMDEMPTPILMVTSAGSEEMTQLSFRAIGGGALDVVEKPAGPVEAQAIVRRLRLMAGVQVRQRVPQRPRTPDVESSATLWRPSEPLRTVAVVAMAISTGGPPVIERILKALDGSWKAALVVVQHLSPGFGDHLVEWLAHDAGIPVALATPDAQLTPGTAWIAPPDRHLSVRMGGRLLLDGQRERVDGHRPSGTVLLESVAAAYGSRAAGVVLTGMGHDGARGLLALRRAGGLTAAQDRASSAVDGMPRAARDLGAAEHVVALDDLSAFVRRLGGGEA